MLRRINERRQITLPPQVMENSGVKIGDYLEVKPEDGEIILIPKSVEDKFLTEKEWKKLEKIVKKQRSQKKFTLYSKAEEAKKHSQRLINEV